MNQQQEQQVNQLIDSLQLTQVEQLQLAAIENEHAICELLGWDDMQYSRFIHNSGRNYLTFYFNGHEDLINKYEANKYFWAWWKLGFIARDMAYLESKDELKVVSHSNRLTIYLHLHDCLHLSNDMKPNFNVFDKMKKQEVENG